MEVTYDIFEFEQFQNVIKQILQEQIYPDKDVKLRDFDFQGEHCVGLTITEKDNDKQSDEFRFIVAPTHNITKYYEKFKTDRNISINGIINEIITVQKKLENESNMNNMLNFAETVFDVEFVKNNIYYVLANEKSVLKDKDIIHRKLDDTDIERVYRLRIPNEVAELIIEDFKDNAGIASVLITNMFIKQINNKTGEKITEQDLYNWSLTNTPNIMKMKLLTTDLSILDFIIKQVGDEDKLDEFLGKYNSVIKILNNDECLYQAMRQVGRVASDPFYVLLSAELLEFMDKNIDIITFENNIQLKNELIIKLIIALNIIRADSSSLGAGAILYQDNLIPRILCKLLGKKRVYFIPSSVGEVVLSGILHERAEDFDILKNLIEAANKKISSEEEVLSNCVLAYDYNTNTYQSLPRFYEGEKAEVLVEIMHKLSEGASREELEALRNKLTD